METLPVHRSLSTTTERKHKVKRMLTVGVAAASIVMAGCGVEDRVYGIESSGLEVGGQQLSDEEAAAWCKEQRLYVEEARHLAQEAKELEEEAVADQELAADQIADLSPELAQDLREQAASADTGGEYELSPVERNNLRTCKELGL